MTTCASASEALRSKVSLPFFPAAPLAQGKTVSAEKIAIGELFRRPQGIKRSIFHGAGTA